MSFYTNAVRRGNKILYRAVIDGMRQHGEVKFQPTLYIPSKDKTEFKGLRGERVAPMKFSSMREARNFVDQYEDFDGFDVHGMTDYVSQYLSEQYPGTIEYDATKIRIGILDIEVFSGSTTADGEVVKGPFPDPAEAKYPITAITIHDNFTDTFYTWGLGQYIHDPNDPDVGHLKVEYTACASERDLLKAFLLHMRQNLYDIVSGWNSEGFDIPYIVTRCFNLHEIEWLCEWESMLSPWGSIRDRQITTAWGSYTTYEWEGVSLLDYLQVYKGFGTYSEKPSYKLDYIANEELGTGKVDYSEAGSLDLLYKTDFQKYIVYNIRDVDLIKMMDEKMQLFSIVFAVAYKCKCSFNDTLATVKPWDCFIHDYLKKTNTVVPPKRKDVKLEQYPGGYVMEPVPGKYMWCISLDLNSLYPHVIQQYNLGPETWINPERLPPTLKALHDRMVAMGDDERIDLIASGELDLSCLKGKPITMAANGHFFRTDKMSVLSEIMRGVYGERKVVKKSMIGDKQELVKAKEAGDPKEIKRLEASISAKDAEQMALKILMNSGYGAIANIHFRYYQIEVASAITCGGQTAIKWAGRMVRDYLKPYVDGQDLVCYGDTDSIFVTLEPLVKKMGLLGKDTTTIVDSIDRLTEEKIQPVITKGYDDLAEYMNAYENRMFMEREKIAEAVIWTAKKRYAVALWDNEGVRYPKPKLSVTGLETKRSTTSEFARGYLEKLYLTALLGTEDECKDLIASAKREFYDLPPFDMSFPTGVNEINKWVDEMGNVKKGCPIHVRAAIVHNQLVERKQTDTTPIHPGDKIKYMLLVEPNPARSYVCAFIDVLPPEFGLERYIDKKGMFDKALLNPANSFLKPIGWSSEKQATLTSFFGGQTA